MPIRPDNQPSDDLVRRNLKDSTQRGQEDATRANLIESVLSGLPGFLSDARKFGTTRTSGDADLPEASRPSALEGFPVLALADEAAAKKKTYEPPVLAREKNIQGRRTEIAPFNYRVDGNGEGFVHWDYAGNVSVRQYYGPNPRDNYTVDTDGNGKKTFKYQDGSRAVLNPDGTGYIRYPESHQYVMREEHFGPKPEDRFGISVRRTLANDWLYEYDDGRTAFLRREGKSGFSRSSRDDQGNYTEKHWGPNPADNYSLTSTKLQDGRTKKSFSNGRTTIESADGTEGYEEIKGDGKWARSERHWGPEDKDYYYKRYKADGSAVIESIPRNESALLDVRAGTSQVFVNQVIAELSTYPRPVIEAMREGGVKIVLTPHLVNYDPTVRSKESRSQPGNTAVSAAIYYSDKKHIVLSENYERDGFSYRSPNPGGGLAHEVGHALDSEGMFTSISDKFNIAFERDLKKLGPADRARFTYITASADSAHPKQYRIRREEATAELTAAALAHKVAGPYTAEDLRKTFPESYEAIAEMLRTRRLLRRIEDT